MCRPRQPKLNGILPAQLYNIKTGGKEDEIKGSYIGESENTNEEEKYHK